MSTRAVATRPFRRGVVIASLLAAAFGLAGCSSGADSSFAGTDEEQSSVDGAESDSGGDGGAISADSPSGDRALIVTGEMYMTVEDPIAAADDATGIVEDAGGRVDARSETAPQTYDGGSAHLTLRIPAPELDPVVEELRSLGTVDEFSTSSADVTREVDDLAAQISTLRASTARIEALLDDAADIKDIITLEDELDSRQAELESLEARQRGLDDQVSMSTIDLSLTTEPVVFVDDSPRTFWSGLASGWDALTAFVSGALVVTGVLIPWLAVAALIAAVVVGLVRASRTRKAAKVAAAPSDPTPPAATAGSSHPGDN
ncbi:DUF4349 domain-containing protein [Demequina phytophila]|uniref:DUF4349 domain-containing protein n=1 Tax=Demequina phytophila TaxID=1638981 RepID=UPI0007857D97|nr:DUF4349 domain-containing protein [Demequina phytophila]